MQECYNPHHSILPVGGGATAGAFVPLRTLCVTCLLSQFERLSTNAVVQALQDTVFLLRQSFSPLFCKQAVGTGCEDSSDASAVPTPSLASLRGAFLSFHEALAQLAEKLCAASALHRHVQLYKAGLALLSLFFLLLREAAEHAAGMGGGADSLEGGLLGTEDRGDEVAGGAACGMSLAGLARRMCEAVRVGLSREGDSPAGLLLLTDLSDMSPTFLRVLSEHCVSCVCAFLPLLRDAYRVELALYLLHQVFETCATHPTLLEGLAAALAAAATTGDAAPRGSFLAYLAGVLETFRDDEPVVVNALCLARFLVTYGTTRTALLLPSVEDGAGSSGGETSAGVPVQLLRHLTLLLLHLNVDIVVAASETVRELLVAAQSVGAGCSSDIADYVIESLRTASADSAVVLVSLLNVLPTEMVPAGPTLRVIFELADINSNAFEAAVKGPHFLAAVTDQFSNVNDVARRVVRTVHDGGCVSLPCFLLQLLSLEAACGGGSAGAGKLPPETVSILANTLLQLVRESCGPALLEDEVGEGQWPFNNRFLSLSSETMRCLASAVAFLLPACQEFMLRLATEIVAEALRQCLELGCAAVDSRCLLFDGSTGTVLLFLSSAVLEHAAAAVAIVRGDEITAADGLVWRQVRHLLENDLLTQLLRVPGDAAALRARILRHFMRLVEANRNAASTGLPDALLLHDSASPRALLEKSFCHHPHWAASLLLTLAATGCPAPVEVHVLEEFFFSQLARLPCFSEEARRLATAGGGGGDDGDDDEGHTIAALAALKTSAAYYRWRGELPHRGPLHVDSVAATARVCGVPEELSCVFLQLFRSEERAWLDALRSCSWGPALLAVLVSFAVVHMKCDSPAESVKEAHEYLFSAAGSHSTEEEASLCRIVVTRTSTCNLFLAQLFGIVRGSVAANLSLSRRVICFLCQCLALAAGEAAAPTSTAFTRALLEQHLTPFLLFRELSALAGDVARLLVLALARLPLATASCCDHTLFKWSLQHVTHPQAQVYAWHAVFLLLERAHGNEFALRYESELEGKLRAGWAECLSPCVAAALATTQWMVDGAMRRRGVRRTTSIVPLPLKECPRAPSQPVLLRGFIISAVERQTRGEPPDMSLLQAAPMLLAWANDMFARRCATVATARLLYTLVKMCPALLASLEALGLFLQVTTAAATGACPAATPFQLSLIEERAWVFAALLFSWPPWGVAGGLKEAVDAFLAALEMPPRACHGQKRSRDEEAPLPHVHEAAGARCAVEALVEACERQSEEHGAFPLNRAKDFFLRGHNARPEVDVPHEVAFASVHEGCELFILP
ncbi:uncharacterized protein Tco025E_05825 [Trypanosoma conorhini]|uniref:Uncharacterized protein n=1 Tax=Trypanosoma conorhini TaxID=83891 RepID=A0A3R7KSK2_9TRYP|nr:uncharacterized protein Tco025E_05825 [Trypanosoma conorhini]RNF14493.1 hypothetical protein Tco025E_05825 [Trypanosoma conorhini]